MRLDRWLRRDGQLRNIWQLRLGWAAVLGPVTGRTAVGLVTRYVGDDMARNCNWMGGGMNESESHDES